MQYRKFLILGLAILTTCSGIPSWKGYGEHKAHPIYPKNAQTYWYTDIEFAQCLGKGKLLLVDISRKGCKMCKVFLEDILPNFNLKDYICIASDVDNDTESSKIMREFMKSASTLPVVMILSPSGQFIRGISGPQTQDVETVRRFLNTK